MKVVVDSSLLIDGLRDGNNWKDFIVNLETGTKLYLPTVVIFELFSGQSSKNIDSQKMIRKLVKMFEVVDLNFSIAEIAGSLYREHTKKLEAPDYIIAATALELGAYIATLNRKHFSQIPGLLLLH